MFQASYSGLFKGFVDVIPDGTLAGVPVLLGATAGTARHNLVTETALRPLFTYLKALSVPTAVFAASEDFGAAWAGVRLGDGEHREEPLSQRIRRAGEAARFVERLGRREPVDAFADFTPMDDLLGRLR